MAGIYLWHFLVLPATVVLSGIGHLFAATGAGFRILSPSPPRIVEIEQGDSKALSNEVPTPASTLLSRRQLLAVATAAAPPIVCGVGTIRALSNVGEFWINRVMIPLRSLPAELDGLTIAHVSDTHVGSFTNAKMLDAVVDQTNRLKADLVLFTGDLINHTLADLPEAIEMAKRLRGDLGVYLCEGNHDLLQDREAFEQNVRAAGLNLLVNEGTIVTAGKHDIQLLGLRWGGRLPFATRVADPNSRAVTGPVQTIVPKINAGAFPILLAHHPHAFDAAANAGIPLTLAGHTHGGQIMAARDIGFGPLMFRYWSGLYRQQTAGGADAALFVSNGVGNWFPLRVNAPAEIVYLTLTRAN